MSGVHDALERLRTPPSLPPDARTFVGRYLDGRVSVQLEADTLTLRLSATAAPLNLTYTADGSTPTLAAFRATPRAPPGGVEGDCRHVDDGTDQEYAYFYRTAPGANATKLRFMDGLFDRLREW